MSNLSPGQLVSAIVVEHKPFGIFVDLGEDELGVVVITMIKDDSTIPNPPFPALGSQIEAVFLGYSGPGKQPRLSLRPMDLRKARSV
jgi:predicted RNA-binding protein with RPS1 domain